MDENCEVSSHKKQKLQSEGKDIISNLPDPILHRILSFLPTEDAVRTSILSKRWEYLWKFTSNFEFKENTSGGPDKSSLFINFVERVLLLHDSSNIEKFSLSSNRLADASHINAWICAALRLKVQALDLCLESVQEPVVLPHCLFTCESLQTLKLAISCDLKLPASIYFSSLKDLTLRGITFPDDHLTQQLFSGCPVMKRLSICKCSWENVKAVSISSPMLESLEIIDSKVVDYDSDEYYSDSSANSDSNQTRANCCHIAIFGINLKSFLYLGEFRNDYCLYDSSILLDAHIEVHCYYLPGREREVAYRAHKLLRELSNVKRLTLSVNTIRALNHAEEFLVRLPVFYNLTHLEITGDNALHVSYPAFVSMLQNSPCLDCLKLELVDCFLGQAPIFNAVPSCFSTHLKTINISYFCCSEEEMKIVKTLLQQATVLERMHITPPYDFREGDTNELKKVLKQVLMLPRASANCEISISNAPHLFWTLRPNKQLRY